MGFPNRVSRTALGGPFEDRGPVRNPRKDLAANLYSLLCWQAAGMNVCSDRAWALIAWTGAAVQLSASGEAWDPDGGYLPTLERVGVGHYRLTYAATYPDENGNLVAPGLIAAKAYPQFGTGLAAATAVVDAGGRVVDVYVRQSGVATDGAVLVELK